MTRIVPVALALALAGCLSPAAPHEGVPSPSLPDTQTVDLHTHLLNITMPAGQPTALVVLNITKDMWVRPFAGAGPVPPIPSVGRDPTFWVLCPWVRSIGLPDTMGFGHFPFWLDGTTLSVATKSQDGQDGQTDADGGRCAALVTTYGRGAAIASNQPHDGRLVLLLAAGPPIMDFPRSQNPREAPEFHLVVGIARSACPSDPSSLCPPRDEAPAEPFLRAPMRVDARHYVTGPSCTQCGLTIHDNSTRIAEPGRNGALSTGTVTAYRTGDLSNGLTILRPSTDGPTDVDIRLISDGTTAAIRCHADQYGFFWIIASHRLPQAMRIQYDMRANFFWGIEMKEFPVDLDALGWHFETTRLIETVESIATDSTAGECEP